ncbi:hypothetical protein O6H91_03G087400 [Diphasiastrum complanatum]|uniref:Uncharacterized protein n=1 Tax=Diphasiastrum complanatum TaxID=34168 RepID=A0ACC2E8B8_DIPCM|nr:hypothetical protein O6H91_03G087400 [Diphasiastrum complanatum]
MDKSCKHTFFGITIGVGFSYSNKSTDYDHFSDNGAAEDALAFFLAWFQNFPEYKSNEFYLIGESYAGTWNLAAFIRPEPLFFTSTIWLTASNFHSTNSEAHRTRSICEIKF